jgi:Flp pilus assembly protein protease CpaA
MKKTITIVLAIIIVVVILSWLLLYTDFLTDAQLSKFVSTHAMLINFFSAFLYPVLAAAAVKLLAVMDRDTPSNSLLDFVRNSTQFGRAPAQNIDKSAVSAAEDQSQAKV